MRSKKQTMSIMEVLNDYKKQDTKQMKAVKNSAKIIEQRNKKFNAYREAHKNATDLGKLQHKSYYKTYVSGKYGAMATFRSLELERRHYLQKIIVMGYGTKKSRYEGHTDVATSSAVVNWMPSHTKEGKKYPHASDLGNTATFNRAVAGARKYTRNLSNADMDSPSGQKFVTDIVQRNNMSPSKAKELRNIRSRTYGDSFLRNQDIYEAYGSEIITAGNKLSTKQKAANNVWGMGTDKATVAANKKAILSITSKG